MNAIKRKNSKLSKDACYDIVIAPWVTEKTTQLTSSDNSKNAFRVAPHATKPMVKDAIEKLFNVEVKAVNIVNQKGKVKRFRGYLGRRSDVKKAIVTLAAGQNIDLTAKIS